MNHNANQVDVCEDQSRDRGTEKQTESDGDGVVSEDHRECAVPVLLIIGQSKWLRVVARLLVHDVFIIE